MEKELKEKYMKAPTKDTPQPWNGLGKKVDVGSKADPSVPLKRPKKEEVDHIYTVKALPVISEFLQVYSLVTCAGPSTDLHSQVASGIKIDVAYPVFTYDSEDSSDLIYKQTEIVYKAYKEMVCRLRVISGLS